MPSYPYNPQYRLPPTPPEDCYSSYSNNMGAMNYQQGAYAPHLQGRRQDERGCGYNEYYQISQLPPVPVMPMYQQTTYYNHGHQSVPLSAPPTANYYRPLMGPILPPIRNYEPSHTMMPEQSLTSRDHSDRRRPETKEDKPVGGVSAKLDYDMEEMTDFVAETSQAMYDLLNCSSISLADIDIAGSVAPTRPTPPGFRKWVHQVLSATRLPSSTILLAFDYLAEHMRNIQTPHPVEASESELHRLLTTALILGSKFLDDNTFINKSWAEVSSIDVATLNYMERSWLGEISFRLHRDPNSPHGFQSFYARWKNYETKARNARNKPVVNTAIAVPAAQHLYSPASVQNSFGHLSPRDVYNSQFDSFNQPRSTGTSPPSAPHTGPTTPEYYGHQAQWGSLNTMYPRHPATTYSSAAQIPALTQASAPIIPQSALVPISYPPPAPVYASGHGVDCMCVSCTRQFMMVPHFGFPQSVAG